MPAMCYAYMLGPERKEFRANDNGEPSGTAGKPIFGANHSYELTDVLIIVVPLFRRHQKARAVSLWPIALLLPRR